MDPSPPVKGGKSQAGVRPPWYLLRATKAVRLNVRTSNVRCFHQHLLRLQQRLPLELCQASAKYRSKKKTARRATAACSARLVLNSQQQGHLASDLALWLRDLPFFGQTLGCQPPCKKDQKGISIAASDVALQYPLHLRCPNSRRKGWVVLVFSATCSFQTPQKYRNRHQFQTRGR